MVDYTTLSNQYKRVAEGFSGEELERVMRERYHVERMNFSLPLDDNESASIASERQRVDIKIRYLEQVKKKIAEQIKYLKEISDELLNQWDSHAELFDDTECVAIPYMEQNLVEYRTLDDRFIKVERMTEDQRIRYGMPYNVHSGARKEPVAYVDHG